MTRTNFVKYRVTQKNEARDERASNFFYFVHYVVWLCTLCSPNCQTDIDSQVECHENWFCFFHSVFRRGYFFRPQETKTDSRFSGDLKDKISCWILSPENVCFHISRYPYFSFFFYHPLMSFSIPHRQRPEENCLSIWTTKWIPFCLNPAFSSGALVRHLRPERPVAPSLAPRQTIETRFWTKAGAKEKEKWRPKTIGRNSWKRKCVATTATTFAATNARRKQKAIYSSRNHERAKHQPGPLLVSNKLLHTAGNRRRNFVRHQRPRNSNVNKEWNCGRGLVSG